MPCFVVRCDEEYAGDGLDLDLAICLSIYLVAEENQRQIWIGLHRERRLDQIWLRRFLERDSLD